MVTTLGLRGWEVITGARVIVSVISNSFRQSIEDFYYNRFPEKI